VGKKLPELTAEVDRLSRQNAALRREIARLHVYRAMAYRDPLTGLWNRRFFEERLDEELSRSQRAGSQRRFSVMVLDLDEFKATNDRHGHPAGDAVLKDVGAFLVAHLRQHDVACRTGGDEFSVLLPDLSAADCGHLLTRLRDAQAIANKDRTIPISFSMGTASWPDAGDSAEALQARADEAMYADKRAARARALPTDIATRRRKKTGTTRRLGATPPARQRVGRLA
jgi:diguanylate cyclase (GGDEF)-like protein